MLIRCGGHLDCTEYLFKKCVFLFSLQDGIALPSPVTLKVDDNGFFLYWLAPPNQVRCRKRTEAHRLYGLCHFHKLIMTTQVQSDWIRATESDCDGGSMIDSIYRWLYGVAPSFVYFWYSLFPNGLFLALLCGFPQSISSTLQSVAVVLVSLSLLFRLVPDVSAVFNRLFRSSAPVLPLVRPYQWFAAFRFCPLACSD